MPIDRLALRQRVVNRQRLGAIPVGLVRQRRADRIGYADDARDAGKAPDSAVDSIEPAVVRGGRRVMEEEDACWHARDRHRGLQ